MKLKKLVSLNPNKYREMGIDVLAERYWAYRNYCERTGSMKTTPPKMFTEWRKTEI